MIIVIEGCDGAGKTTLAQQLAERYHLEVHHEGPPPPDVPPLERYGALVEKWRWRTQNACGETIVPPTGSPSNEGLASHGIVFDRLAMGERVYGSIYRKNDRLGPDGWRVFRRLLTAANAVEILCMPSFETCKANWEARKGREMIEDAQTFQEIYDGFATFVDQKRTQYVYDYTLKRPGFEGLCAYIDRFNEFPRLPPGVVGSNHAQYLFVGDRGSDPHSQTTDLAFFGTTDSSAYLTRALEEAGFTEDEVAFVNATRHDGKPSAFPVQGLKIIALGQQAGDECARRRLEHDLVPHPQYWKRFHHAELHDYVALLKGCR